MRELYLKTEKTLDSLINLGKLKEQIMKVAFLDRDGTIIKDYPDKEWKNIKAPKFLEGSVDALQHIKKQGFEIIIITNQYLIGEGIITLEDYQNLALLKVDRNK